MTVVPRDVEIRKKGYLSPQVRSRTFEQAALVLVGHAWNGDQQARDLLELMFREPGEKQPNYPPRENRAVEEQ